MSNFNRCLTTALTGLALIFIGCGNEIKTRKAGSSSETFHLVADTLVRSFPEIGIAYVEVRSSRYRTPYTALVRLPFKPVKDRQVEIIAVSDGAYDFTGQGVNARFVRIGDPSTIWENPPPQKPTLKKYIFPDNAMDKPQDRWKY